MSVKSEIMILSYKEKAFVFFSMLACFFIAGEYAIVRPASQSIFLAVFSAKAFPTIWLATIPLNFAVISLYNRFLPRFGPLAVMGFLTTLIAGVNVLLAFLLPIFPKLIFFHFCWKDIYILLMFKQLWSMIHSTIPSSRAKLLYGLIFGLGTCGSIVCSLIPGFFAQSIGSEKLFLFTLPFYAVILFAYSKAYRISGAQEFKSARGTPIKAREGFSLIAKNKYLLAVLLLVVFMQMSIAIVEYQFGHRLETLIPDTNLRTAFTGKILSLIHCVSLLLQFVGSFVLVRVLGFQNSHFLVPLLLLFSSIGLAFNPEFLIVASLFVMIKSLDFSLFGVVREMLYIPLRIDEQFRAKAVIDVFAYRTSKAIAALALIGLQIWLGSSVFAFSNYLSMVIYCGWIAVVATLLRRHAPPQATATH
jgi:ATP/ADP translocase